VVSNSFNTRANLNYVGRIPDVSLYGVDEMSASDRREFVTWFDREKYRIFDNRRMLVYYCQDDSTVIREACTIFRRDFIEIGNIEVFLEAYTIAIACNKLLRNKFLKPHTIGMIHAGVYSCNRKYNKKALMWLLHMEQVDGCRIAHARNGREYRLPNYRLIVWMVIVTRQGPRTSSGVPFYGHTYRPFSDLRTTGGDNLIEVRTHDEQNRADSGGRYKVKIQ